MPTGNTTPQTPETVDTTDATPAAAASETAPVTEATGSTETASTETGEPGGRRATGFLGRHGVSLVLAAALVGAIVWGVVATRDGDDREAEAADLTVQLADTTAAKESAEAQVVALTAEKEELQGDLDECRSTVEASDAVFAVNEEAGAKLEQFLDTLGLVMGSMTEAEFNQHSAAMEAQNKELEEIGTRFDAAEKTYTERTSLCED